MASKRKLVPGKMKPPEPRGRRAVGRPTSYREAYAVDVVGLCRAGMDNDDLAAQFHVDESTIRKWINDIPEFSRGVAEGRSQTLAQVANSLVHKANGYSHPEEKIVFNPKSEKFVRTKTIKHYPPDTPAALAYLAAHKPEVWGRKAENISVKVELKQLILQSMGEGGKTEDTST